MKTARLIIGIISCALVLIVMFQSCTVTVVTSFDDVKDLSGAAGAIFGVFLLAAGITAIAGRKSRGGTIAAGILYLLGGWIGLSNKGTYGDLEVWSWLAIIFGVFFFISLFFDKPSTAKETAAPVSAAPYAPAVEEPTPERFEF